MKRRTFYSPLLLLLLLGVLLIRWQTLPGTSSRPSAAVNAIPSSVNHQRIEQLRLELATRSDETSAHDRALARAVAKENSSFATIAKLVGLLTRDALGNSDETQPYLESLLEPSLQSVVNEEIDGLNANPAIGSVTVSGNFGKPLRRLGLSSAGVGLIGGADLLLLPRSTLIKGMVQKIRLRIGGLLSGKIAMVTGSGSAALADGPFPVGDALAVLGLAWTAYDLHDTQSVFEEELETELNHAYRGIRADLHQQVLDSVTNQSGSPP